LTQTQNIGFRKAKTTFALGLTHLRDNFKGWFFFFLSFGGPLKEDLLKGELGFDPWIIGQIDTFIYI